MPTERQKLVAHHVIGLGKSMSATAKQIGASPTSVRGSLISYCIKMMPSLEPALTAWVEHKDRGRHRLAIIRAHKDQLMPAADQKPRATHEQQRSAGEIDVSLSLIEELELQVIALRGNHLLNSSLIVQRAIDALESQTREVERRDGRIAELIAQCNEIYALKAQPSGVVLPERQMYTAYLSGVVPSNAVEVNSYRDGWNACLDEVARLNSSPASAGWMMPTVKQLEQALESVPSFHDLSAELIAPAMLEHLREVISAGEYGDAYQGARQDLLIWKRRALEAETKVREQDQVIENLGNALNAESGPTFMGEPVMPASAGEPLPHWEPCNPGCDPDFNGQRSRECAQLCRPAREALSASAGDERASRVNDWFLSLPPARQAVLRDDKWLLADAAFIAGQARAALSANHSEQVRKGLSIQVCKLGRLGAAYDPADTRYAYTYAEQPDNAHAWRLGEAFSATKPGGDCIDAGLGLLKQLEKRGFGVFQLAAAPSAGSQGGDV